MKLSITLTGTIMEIQDYLNVKFDPNLSIKSAKKMSKIVEHKIKCNSIDAVLSHRYPETMYTFHFESE